MADETVAGAESGWRSVIPAGVRPYVEPAPLAAALRIADEPVTGRPRVFAQHISGR